MAEEKSKLVCPKCKRKHYTTFAKLAFPGYFAVGYECKNCNYEKVVLVV